jgi:hypothetical protein
MTTQSWSTRIRHDSDATFREWGLELNTKLALAGLVQTADTGQIDWSTVTLQASNTDAGYEIWTLSDALAGSAPVYFRIVYGTGGGTNVPVMRIKVGTATDGAGTLSGDTLTLERIIMSQANQTSDTARQSYLCVTEGFFGLSWKTNSGGSCGGFLFCRTVDSSGAPTSLGAMVIWGGGSPNQITATQALRYAATAAAYTARTSPDKHMIGFSPQAPASTQVGADIQAMLGWTITPQIQPLVGICGVLEEEVSDGTTFITTLIGSTSRTYIGLHTESGPFGPGATGAGTGQPKFAMLWE